MAKKNTQKQNTILSPENYIRQRSRNLPVHECWISTDWKKEKIASVTIARKHASGNITYCMYLVDLACLGIKDTTYRYNKSQYEFKNFLEVMKENHPLEEVSYNLAHNIIYAAIEFAEEFGFAPHKDFILTTQFFLEEDTEDLPIIEIECGGDDGKPLYVNAGFESAVRADQILKQLKKTAGEGNYHFIIPADDGNITDDNTKDSGDEEKSTVDIIKDSLCEEDIDVLKKRFLELSESYEKFDNFTENDFLHLLAISEIIMESMADESIVNDYYSCLKNDLEFEPLKSTELPNSLFQGIQDFDGKTLTDMFEDTCNAIHENKKATKAIEMFEEKAGTVSLTEYFRLLHLILNSKSSKKTNNKLEECYNKTPDYFLFKLLWLEHLYISDGNDDSSEQLKSLLHDKDLLITDYEHSEFITKYVEHIYKLFGEYSFEKAIALENFLKYNIYSVQYSVFSLLTTLNILKINNVLEYLKPDEDQDNTVTN